MVNTIGTMVVQRLIVQHVSVIIRMLVITGRLEQPVLFHGTILGLQVIHILMLVMTMENVQIIQEVLLDIEFIIKRKYIYFLK